MDAVTVTGPDALAHDDLLFGAQKPPWLEDWLPALDRIEQILKEGQPIPYLLISKLGYDVIMFYAKQIHEKVRFSYAQEVFQIIANKIVAAAPEGELGDNVHEYLSAFAPLIKVACGPPPTYIVVLATETPTHFGVNTPKDSTQIVVDATGVDESNLGTIKQAVYEQSSAVFPASVQRALGSQPPEHNPISFF
jgi:hypothetical protein